MADACKELRTYLLTKADLVALCSTRIYFGNLPQGVALPAIVLNLIVGESERHLTSNAGKSRSIVQVDCYDDDYADAYALAEEVRDKVENFRGTMGAIYLHRAYVTDQRDLSDAPIDGSQVFRKIRSLDVTLHHAEAISTPST